VREMAKWIDGQKTDPMWERRSEAGLWRGEGGAGRAVCGLGGSGSMGTGAGAGGRARGTD
jgi:hypothetical protein